MPMAASRANSTAQPGSSTITGSPARSKVRLTMSSAWVAPTVVMICSGAACTDSVASFLDKARRRPKSPSGSPYCSENSCSALVPVTLRTAAGMKVVSSHSGGNTPIPGCGLLLTLWNMPRIRAVASIGRRGCPAEAAANGVAATTGDACPISPGRGSSRTKNKSRRYRLTTDLTICSDRVLPRRLQ